MNPKHKHAICILMAGVLLAGLVGLMPERVGLTVAPQSGDGSLHFTADELQVSDGYPGNLAYGWHTFFGSFMDYSHSVTVDQDGNIYFIGNSDESWNGPGGIPPVHSHSGMFDIVVVKLAKDGSYEWHTFFGAGSDDQGLSIAIDKDGFIYVTGYLSTNLIVLKLNNNGEYLWDTSYGAESVWDGGWNITVDDIGNVFVTGFSYKTWQGPNGENPLNPHTDGSNSDIVILKVNSNGQYGWHTFYGYPDNGGIYCRDNGHGITLDGDGNIFVAGRSCGTWNGPDNEEPLNPFYEDYDSDDPDMVLLKLSSDGAYQWHTFYGGDLEDGGVDVLVSGRDVYFLGRSGDEWLGPNNESSISGGDGNSSVLVKLSNDGTYRWHRFFALKGLENDCMAFSNYGTILVTGTMAGQIALISISPVTEYYDLAEFGSDKTDTGRAIAVDKNGNVILLGNSAKTWNGPNGEAPLNPHGGFVEETEIPAYDFTIVKLVHTMGSVFRSVGVYDGWVRESQENSGKGGSKDEISSTFYLGDDAGDRQYRGILHFNTGILPDNVVVESATLDIKPQSIVGTNPFLTHQSIVIDIRSGGFNGNSVLQLIDFQAGASKNWAGLIKKMPTYDGWYSVTLNNAVLPYINLTGPTQFRLRFVKDDNDDMADDFIRFFSGNHPYRSYRPLLKINYYIP